MTANNLVRRIMLRAFRGRPTGSPRRDRVRLLGDRVEALEDRTTPATFAGAGTLLTLDLNTASDHLAIVSNGTSYTLTLTGDTWSGTNSANVTGNGTATLTVTAAGIAAFTSGIDVTDSAPGTSVAFTDSGANAYANPFDVVLDSGSAGVTFAGSSAFGAHALTVQTDKSIVVNPGTVSTTTGDLTLSANRQAAATTGDFVGVRVVGGTVQSTGTGVVTVTGRGGNAAGGGQYGVEVQSGGVIRGGTTGTVTVTGTGGASAGDANSGVLVSDAKSAITSAGAAVSVTGTGGGTGTSKQDNGVGVQLGGTITAGGAGTVTVTGTGGATSGDSNYGVVVDGGSGPAAITSGGGAVSVTGTGGGTGMSQQDYGVSVQSSGTITAGGTGTVTVTGTGGATSGSFDTGVIVTGAQSAITSGGGAVAVTGHGGGTGASQQDYGVNVQDRGTITAGGTGTVTVTGTGGATSGGIDIGVYVSGAVSAITSGGGAVAVTGTGGGTGTSGQNYGVGVEAGGTITAGGTGSVTVTGTGGTTSGNFDYGVEVGTTGTTGSAITSGGGAVSVTGTGGGSGAGSNNDGVLVQNGGTITAGGSGTVTVTGTGGPSAGTANFGVFVTGTNAAITSGGGDVSVTGTAGGGTSVFGIELLSAGTLSSGGTGRLTITTDSLNAIAGTTIRGGGASDQTVTIRQRTPGTAIDVGGADAPGTLGLDATDLGTVVAGTLAIGDAATGPITVSANPALTGVTILVTIGATGGGRVTLNASIPTANGAGLTITPNVSLGASVSVATGAGDIAFGGTIDGAQALVLTTSGATTLTGAVGGTTALTALDVTTGSLTAGAIRTTGGVTVHDTGPGVIAGPVAGAGAPLTKQGAGTLTLTGANSYTGATTITAGTVVAADNTALGINTPVSVAAGATLRTTAANLTVGSLQGDGSVALDTSGTLTAGADNTSQTFGGVISGTGGLIKVGTGTETLGGPNTYTGPTTVTAGTLVVNGAQPLSPVAVSPGATLGGAGTVGPLTLAAGASFLAPVGPAVTPLTAAGPVDLGGATLALTPAGVVPVGTGVTVLKNTSGAAITGTFAGLAEGATVSAGGRSYRITYLGGTGADAALTAIPTAAQDLAVGGPNGQVLLFPPNAPTGQYATTPAATLAPFGTATADVRTAVADVNGDGIPDTICVTGPGTPIRVAVVSGADHETLLVQPFDPFGGDFTGGGFVAAGDFDLDGRAEIVVTPDQGGGPRVSIFSLLANGQVTTRANFFGIDDPNFRGGARAAVGDVDGDGTPDLAVAAGFGGGPRVALFRGTSLFSAPARLVNDFFAFPGTDAVNLRNGAYVAAGDVNGDGVADLIFGGGPGGAPRVFILSGHLVAAGNIQAAYDSPVANFFVANNSTDRGGVRVAAVNADGDGKADVAAGSGAGSPARVRVYLGKNFSGTGEPGTFQDLTVFGGTALADGVYVG